MRYLASRGDEQYSLNLSLSKKAEYLERRNKSVTQNIERRK